MITLEKSKNILDKYYAIALGMDDLIKKPIAWALYQTWKEIDHREKPQERKRLNDSL